MESVGQKLRDARLRRNLALEDVSAATKINVRNLQAIEADDLTQICSPFTYRSFARQFANFLQLNGAEFDAALIEMSNKIPAPLVPGEGGAPVASTLKQKKPGKLRWALTLSSLGLMLALCSAFYGAWQTARSDFHGTVATFTNSFSPQVTSKPQAPPALKTQVNDRSAVSAPLVPAAVPSAPQNFRIELSAIERCWLSVVTDGKEVFAGTLQPSQTKVLDGQEEAKIRAGNAGGVTVSFNGRSIGTLGPEGTVRTVVFTKNGYEVLQPFAGIIAPVLTAE